MQYLPGEDLIVAGHAHMSVGLVDEDCAPGDEDCIHSAVLALTSFTTAVFAGSPPRMQILIDNQREGGSSDDPQHAVHVGPGVVKLRTTGCVLDLPLTPEPLRIPGLKYRCCCAGRFTTADALAASNSGVSAPPTSAASTGMQVAKHWP